MVVQGVLTGPPISQGGGSEKRSESVHQSIRGQVCFHQYAGSCECGMAERGRSACTGPSVWR